MRRSIVFVLRVQVFALVALMLMCGTALAEKPKPVKELVGIFDNFNDLETQIRAEKWDEAQRALKDIEIEYKRIIGKLKGTVDDKLLHKFSFHIGSFRKKMESKDPEEVEKPYMNMQEMFVDIMDYYDYPYPPVLQIVELYIEEAKEFLEKNNYRGVEEEMEEIDHFKKRSMKAAADAGLNTRKLGEMFELGEDIEGLAKKKDKERIGSTLDQMGSILASMRK